MDPGLRPHEGGLNPYHLGFRVWEDIRKRYDETPLQDRAEKLSSPKKTGLEMLFWVRETERDVSFLRRFLTEDLMREMDIFTYEAKDEDLVVGAVSDTDGWQRVKEKLLLGIGMNSVPIIKVHDADFNGSRTLLMVHEHDGRDLELTFAEKTLAHVHTLWGRDVALRTNIGGKSMLLRYNHKGFKSNNEK